MPISWAWVIGIFIFLFFFAIAVGVTIWILSRLKWNYSWVLLQEQPNGISEIVRRGRCRLMAFGDGGEEIFYLKEIKKWRVAYGKRIGKNQIAWAQGQDGYWYNTSLGPIDKRLLEVGVYPVDRDMRYAYASARKGLDRDYDKKTFMEKYGTLMSIGAVGILILLLCLFSWFNYNGQAKVAAINNQAVESTSKLVEAQKDVLQSLSGTIDRMNNIKSTGGSGTITVPQST